MAYEWRPTGSPTATTTSPRAIVPAAGQRKRSPPQGILAAAVIEEFIVAAEAGLAHNRSGRSYQPSALRDVRGILRHHVAPDIGELPIGAVNQQHLQAIADRLATQGLSESRIRSVVSAIRALYSYAIERGYVELSPATGLVIPSPGAGAPKYETGSTWSDDVDDMWDEGPITEGEPPARPRARDLDDYYEPIVLITERILSLVLRIAVIAFIVFALITIAGSA